MISWHLKDLRVEDVIPYWEPTWVIDNGKIASKQPNQTWYYEYLPSQYVRGRYIDEVYVGNYSNPDSAHTGKVDQHMSVFAHDDHWVEHITNTGKVGNVKDSLVKLDWLWIEIDGDDIGRSMYIARQIIANGPLRNYMANIRVFWSGNRSIHIAVDGQLFGNLRGSQDWLAGDGKVAYQIAHRLVSHMSDITFPYLEDIEYLKEVANKQRVHIPDHGELRKHFEVIDPNLYRVNSTIRLTGSVHPKTNKPKVEIGVSNLFRNHIEYQQYKPCFTPPNLLYLVKESLTPIVTKNKSYSKHFINLSANEYEVIYSKYMSLDGYQSGDWINKLYSPFYEDHNPSVAIDLSSGTYKDFGNPSDTFSVEEFVSKIENVGIVDATNIIHNILHEPVRSDIIRA
jgi:hypothetical protein